MTRVSRILPYLIFLAIYINTQLLCRRDLTSRNLQIYFVSMGFISNKTFYILRSLVRNILFDERYLFVSIFTIPRRMADK